MPCRHVRRVLLAVILTTPIAALSIAQTGQSAVAAIQAATNGQFKSAKGKYFSKDCNEQVDYEAEAIDLNGDGQLEVFTKEYGSCIGGRTGVHMNLYIKTKAGLWKAQFGFPGMYKILTTQSKGYPDIEIGGPGTCFPIWRWDGQKYDIHKKCR